MAIPPIELTNSDIKFHFEVPSDVRDCILQRFTMMGTAGEDMTAKASTKGVEITIEDVEARDDAGYPITRSFIMKKQGSRHHHRFAGKGWKDFKAAHNLQVGDQLFFQFTLPNRADLTLWIVRADPAPDDDIDLFPRASQKSPYARSTIVFAQLIANQLNGEPAPHLYTILTYAKNPSKWEEKALIVSGYLSNPSTIPLGLLPNTNIKFRDFINTVQKYMASSELISIIEGPNTKGNTIVDIFPDAYDPSVAFHEDKDQAVIGVGTHAGEGRAGVDVEKEDSGND